jgi:hypothetical protein
MRIPGIIKITVKILIDSLPSVIHANKIQAIPRILNIKLSSFDNI